MRVAVGHVLVGVTHQLLLGNVGVQPDRVLPIAHLLFQVDERDRGVQMQLPPSQPVDVVPFDLVAPQAVQHGQNIAEVPIRRQLGPHAKERPGFHQLVQRPFGDADMVLVHLSRPKGLDVLLDQFLEGQNQAVGFGGLPPRRPLRPAVPRHFVAAVHMPSRVVTPSEMTPRAL